MMTAAESPERESRRERAGRLFVQAVEWLLKAGSAFAIWLAIAAAFNFWPFAEPPDVRIDIAASQVNSKGDDSASAEYICLVNMSSDEVDLLGWEMRDAEGSVNVLPDLTLGAGQHLRVHPGGGHNSGSDVYGEGDEPVWNNQGDTATLLDESGDVIDTQTYGSRQNSLENAC